MTDECSPKIWKKKKLNIMNLSITLTNMKLTNKQKTDLETILYFIPEVCNNIKITDKDIERFFEYSDQ